MPIVHVSHGGGTLGAYTFTTEKWTASSRSLVLLQEDLPPQDPSALVSQYFTGQCEQMSGN